MFSSSAIEALVGMLVTFVLARLLAPADFGLVAAAMVVIRFSELFVTIGLGPALVQMPDLQERHLRTAFAFSVSAGAGVGALIWAATPLLVGLFNSAGLTPVLRTLTLAFPLAGLTVVAEALLQRNLRFSVLARVHMMTSLVANVFVGVGLALLGFGVWALVAAFLSQAGLRALLLNLAQPHAKAVLFEVRSLRQMLRYASGITLTRLGSFLALQGDNLIVGRALGMEALGLYTRAYSLMGALVTLLGSVLDRVLFPELTRLQDQPERLGVVFRRGSAAMALLILPFSALLFVLAPETIWLLLGPGWDAAIVPFQIFTLGILFRTSYKIAGAVSKAMGAVYRQALAQALYAVLVVAGAFAARHWGISGVALAVLGAIIAHHLMLTRLALKLTTLSWLNYLAAHRPAGLLFAVVAAAAFLTAGPLRAHGSAPLAVLAVSTLAAGAVTLLLCRLMPKLFLGPDGRWLLAALAPYSAKAWSRFSRAIRPTGAWTGKS